MLAIPKMKGQAAVGALFLIVVACAMLLVLYNSGRAVSEKTRLVNAADASAYSSAVWTARHMNYLAYTNRAMVANHLVVGHFTSYVSWLRYVDEAIGDFNRVANDLSPIKQATRNGRLP